MSITSLRGKKIDRILEKSHENIERDLVIEFARRMGGFIASGGLTRVEALEATKLHYRKVGECMVSIANNAKLQEELASVLKDPKENRE